MSIDSSTTTSSSADIGGSGEESHDAHVLRHGPQLATSGNAEFSRSDRRRRVVPSHDMLIMLLRRGP